MSPSRSMPSTSASHHSSSSFLTDVIDELADLLPAQGPISIFIHHNTLHAFEHLPFEEAVELAGERLGCEPFLAESRYRDKLASGRILARDVDALLRLQLGARGADDVAGAGYLDQGLAPWSMPFKDRGIHGCFLEIYGAPLATHCGPWARQLPGLVADDHVLGRNALASIEYSLGDLGVAEDEWTDYLTAEL